MQREEALIFKIYKLCDIIKLRNQMSGRNSNESSNMNSSIFQLKADILDRMIKNNIEEIAIDDKLYVKVINNSLEVNILE